MSNTPLVEVRNLKKYFPTPSGTLHAVDGVNFTIDQGETLGVVGESGCGKSTLGRVILHLLDSTDGQIFFEGEDVTKVSRKKLVSLRQDYADRISGSLRVFGSEKNGKPDHSRTADHTGKDDKRRN